MSEFVHLHVHTEYSLLDGACRITDVISRAKELGQTAIAITDHGNMYGVVDFYKEAVKQGIKPIIGCEVYTAPRGRFQKEGKIDSTYGHLILLAQNQEGYQNLIKIVSKGFTEGFYYKPRIDWELLETYRGGLIALSACLAGDIPRALLAGDWDKAVALVKRFQAVFGTENFYLEMQDHGLPEQSKLNPLLIRLSRETGAELVVTNDAHYVKREDAKYQDVLMCIQMGKQVDDPERMRFETDDFYLKSAEEMAERFAFCPEALANTKKIADRCQVDFEFGKYHLPEFDLPDGETDSFTYLKKLCEKGLRERYGEPIDGALNDRLSYELDTIRSMGFVDYFLIVSDFIRFARGQGIMVGPGRGSAAGSIVAYALGITNIDPIRYQLLFERFLNPERVTMPDIDIDFCYERRQEVIQYVIQKYGKDNVSQIITFGTMQAKGAIRDVGRALGVSYAETDAVAKMIPNELGMTLNKAMEVNAELRTLYEQDETTKKLIDTARALEGLPRHASTHAAGVVISPKPVDEFVPLQQNDDVVTTQFTMTTIEELGLLKMDFLGLRTLTVIRDAVAMANQNGANVEMDAISYDCPEVYEMIGKGDTDGVFQLESAGMKQFMKELLPKSPEDIIAGISLYRPGPMDSIPTYIKNKNHPEAVTYRDEKLRPILNVTYGCIVYQEQVMQIVRELGGYSLGRADMVRRAMSKKKTDVMAKEREHFIHGIVDETGTVLVEGAVRRHVPEPVAAAIFDEMMDFAKYAFNKSHAAAYAVVAYQTAWLKCFYPTEFLAALMTSVLGDTNKISRYIAEAGRLGIAILPPDVNHSKHGFTVENGAIRMGLCAVKNVGKNFVLTLVKEREAGGVFRSLRDFAQRMAGKDLNKRAVEGLIRCGAFDFVEGNRNQMLLCFEKVLDEAAQEKKRNIEGQLNLFAITEDSDADWKDDFPAAAPLSHRSRLAMEKETVGLYLSGHPLDEYRADLERVATVTVGELIADDEDEQLNNLFQAAMDQKEVTIAGVLTGRKDKTTKNNAMMSFVTLEDLTGAIEVIVFPKVWETYRHLLMEDQILTVHGRLSIRENEPPKLVAESIAELKASKESGTVTIVLTDDTKPKLDAFHQVVTNHRGADRLVFCVDGKEIAVREMYQVQADEPFLSEAKSYFGEQMVTFRKKD